MNTDRKSLLGQRAGTARCFKIYKPKEGRALLKSVSIRVYPWSLFSPVETAA